MRTIKDHISFPLSLGRRGIKVCSSTEQEDEDATFLAA
jgi:hypothetical protein